MTRGTFVLIGNHHFYTSCEFNGDMYPDGHGRLARELLERVETVQDFYKMVTYFNDINHKYTDEYPLVYVGDIKKLTNNTNFNNDYFEAWFSDWLFFKNISKISYTFTYKGSTDQITLKTGEILVVNFGRKPDYEDLKKLGLAGHGDELRVVVSGGVVVDVGYYNKNERITDAKHTLIDHDNEE